MNNRSYEIQVSRVIDIKASIALVQMKDKRVTHLHINRVPLDKIQAFRDAVAKEVTI